MVGVQHARRASEEEERDGKGMIYNVAPRFLFVENTTSFGLLVKPSSGIF